MDIKQDNHKKYIGSCCGNSFIILDCRDVRLNKKFKIDFAKKNIVKYKVDSALFLEKSERADVFMEIFEKDGSESESCGNGAILISYLLNIDRGEIETKSGIIEVKSEKGKQAILASLEVSNIDNEIKNKGYFFVKIGEPHAVYWIDYDIKKFDLAKIGKDVQRYHPKGVNVNVIKEVDNFHYLIRTYERGVYAETKSCGTGSLASYVTVFFLNNIKSKKPIEFKSRGGSHWVSKKDSLFKLETLKKYCKINKL